jgi:[acyl-carrier-protein] S-malonyltransferase
MLLNPMTDIAFLFPGQGSQYVGMGKSLAEAYPEARHTFQEADDALGFALSELCFSGPEDALKQTENTQPALLAVSIAAYRVLQTLGFQPALVAGHSLGEYSALVAAGSLDFAGALRLVRNRGRYMQAAVPVGVGAMAAILKLPAGQLAGVLEQAAQGEIVTAANFNSPDQVVIAGHAGAVLRAMELAKTAGAKRAISLAVSAPFHCPLMRPAQAQLRPELDSTEFKNLSVPLVANWNAQTITSGEQARQGLFQQIPNPVLWADSLLKMADLGVQRFVEVGPGSVLLGLCRVTVPSLKGAKFGDPDDLAKVRELLTN